jgi:hypothetical protein
MTRSSTSKVKTSQSRAQRTSNVSENTTATMTLSQAKRARAMAKFKGKTDTEILGMLFASSLDAAHTFCRDPIQGLVILSIPAFQHTRDRPEQRRHQIQIYLQSVRFFVFFLSVYFYHLIYSHPSILVIRARYEDSTTNLLRHVKGCDPEDPSKQIVAFANGSTYSPARFRYLTAMWCARRHRPFVIVEDPELVEMFQMLYGHVNIPSRFMVSRDIQEIFEYCKRHVSLWLQVCLIQCTQRCLLTFFRPTMARYTLGSMVGHLQMCTHSLASWSTNVSMDRWSSSRWISLGVLCLASVFAIH